MSNATDARELLTECLKWFREPAGTFEQEIDLTRRIDECLAAPDDAVQGFAVRNDQGYWIGIWNDKGIAETVAKGQPPSHNCEVVPVTIRKSEGRV